MSDAKYHAHQNMKSIDSMLDAMNAIDAGRNDMLARVSPDARDRLSGAIDRLRAATIEVVKLATTEPMDVELHRLTPEASVVLQRQRQALAEMLDAMSDDAK